MLSLVLAGLLSAGCSPVGGPLVGAPEMFREHVSSDQCLGRAVVLASGVKVSCTAGEAVAVELTYLGRWTSLNLLRHGDFYGARGLPGTLIVVDHRTVSADRLLVVRLGPPDTKVVELAHPDGGSYVQFHYQLLRMDADSATVAEDQWAGTEPARTRTLRISLTTPFGGVTASPWVTKEP